MSLHWILALTVTLLHCLSAFPTKRDPVISKTLFDETEILINDLKKYSCKENDSTFYSPSGSKECINEALACSSLELKKVQAECFEENSQPAIWVLRVINDTIQGVLNGTNFSANPNTCFCGKEQLEEKPYYEYLDNILKLLQMLNTAENS